MNTVELTPHIPYHWLPLAVTSHPIVAVSEHVASHVLPLVDCRLASPEK